MTGPRDEATWQKVAGAPPARPGFTYFALVALASLALGLGLAAWALDLL